MFRWTVCILIICCWELDDQVSISTVDSTMYLMFSLLVKFIFDFVEYVSGERLKKMLLSEYQSNDIKNCRYVKIPDMSN